MPPTVPPQRPSRHVPLTRQLDGGKTDVLSSANGPSTTSLQQRCHRTSTSARSPSWPPMPGPRPQRAAAVRPEQIQPRIRNRIFSSSPRSLCASRALIASLWISTPVKHARKRSSSSAPSFLISASALVPMTLRNAGHDLDEIALRARLGGVISASAIVRKVPRGLFIEAITAIVERGCRECSLSCGLVAT
jgi:hypothetical protein